MYVWRLRVKPEPYAPLAAGHFRSPEKYTYQIICLRKNKSSLTSSALIGLLLVEIETLSKQRRIEVCDVRKAEPAGKVLDVIGKRPSKAMLEIPKPQRQGLRS